MKPIKHWNGFMVTSAASSCSLVRKRPGWTVWGNEVVDLVPAAAD
jgi:hypothetical protein